MPEKNIAIGEFGAAPDLPVEAGPVVSTGMYWLYEMSHAALNPARAFSDVTRLYLKNPLNPWSHTTFGKTVAASAEMFERFDPPLRQAGVGTSPRPQWSAASASPVAERAGLGAAVLPAAAFREADGVEIAACVGRSRSS
jgi:hypothetical protein